jgi:hypothetical protein
MWLSITRCQKFVKNNQLDMASGPSRLGTTAACCRQAVVVEWLNRPVPWLTHARSTIYSTTYYLRRHALPYLNYTCHHLFLHEACTTFRFECRNRGWRPCPTYPKGITNLSYPRKKKKRFLNVLQISPQPCHIMPVTHRLSTRHLCCPAPMCPVLSRPVTSRKQRSHGKIDECNGEWRIMMVAMRRSNDPGKSCNVVVQRLSIIALTAPFRRLVCTNSRRQSLLSHIAPDMLTAATSFPFPSVPLPTMNMPTGWRREWEGRLGGIRGITNQTKEASSYTRCRKEKKRAARWVAGVISEACRGIANHRDKTTACAVRSLL